MLIRMKPFALFACFALPAMLCTAVTQADGRPGVVRITDNHREQQLISNPIRQVSFDDDDDTCLPPPPVCAVPSLDSCISPAPVAPAPPKCDGTTGTCCPQSQDGCCGNNNCRKIYRCHNFDCRGRCGRCDDDDDDDDDECDCDSCKDARKRWKKWRKWCKKNKDKCGNGVCGNNCGNSACGNGVCGNGCKRRKWDVLGVFGNNCGNCEQGQCGCDPCECDNCQCGNGCGKGKKKWWDPMGIFSGGKDCDPYGNNRWCGLRHHGQGGYGLFGGDCGYDTYGVDCERNWFQRWAHRNHCRRNARAWNAYRRDGFGWGQYQIAYPINPQHFDQRDGRIYAAQGYRIPMAVPTAPNVEHTYNYSWGLPASRITRMSTPGFRTPQGPHDDHYNARVYAAPWFAR